jgi:hypothetical protein
MNAQPSNLAQTTVEPSVAPIARKAIQQQLDNCLAELLTSFQAGQKFIASDSKCQT